MKVVDHPSLEGIKCREDGAVFVPASGTHKGHWTFGTRQRNGYRHVGIARKHYLVHRLITEAFHGLCPPDKCQVDHTNRNRSDNRPENLRWVTYSENNRNKEACDESLAKYGVRQCDDKKAYDHARWATDPEFRERVRVRNRERWANDPEYREKKKASNAKWRAKKKEAA